MAYLSRYISNFSNRSEPLRKITRKWQKFAWSQEQQLTFEDLKKAITSAPVLIPYNPEQQTRVICDGSFPVDSERMPTNPFCKSVTIRNREKIFANRTRSLSSIIYHQETIYVLEATQFELATDHKPLLPIFNNPKVKLPPRIERMVMKIQNLDFTAIYIPGKKNVTDYISRHPLPEIAVTGRESHVNAIINVNHVLSWKQLLQQHWKIKN